MSRRDHTAAGERVASLKAMRAELAVAYGLLETDPRIGQAALVKLNQQNWERDVLVGRPVPNSELQAYTNVVSQLLGPPAVPLNIHFIDGSDVCVTCRGPLPPRSERVPVEPAAAPVEVPPPTAPLPSAPDAKVIPLKPPSPPPSPTPAAPGSFYEALTFANERSGGPMRNPAHGLPMDGRDSWDQRWR
ncbi:MAG: hypothetical protein WCD13_03055 [Pseudolabrys sp.]